MWHFADGGAAELTAEGFDDGRTDVPVGAAEPVERVVVVGAGIAGLTVANALTYGGVECVGEPIGGRLLFAGEHTRSTRLAYADGAMTSGIREAKRLLRQPGVRLGPILTVHR